MDFKKLFRGPIIYILIAIIVVWIGSSLLMQSGFKQVTTQQGLEFITSDKVASAKIVDGEQRVDLTLTEADDEFGDKVQFYYVAPRGTEIVAAVNDANLESFDDEVPQTSLLTSLLFTLLPFLIIGVIFYFLLTRMQGGGGKARHNVGQLSARHDHPDHKVGDSPDEDRAPRAGAGSSAHVRLEASPTRRAMTMAGNRTPSVDKKVASILAGVFTA